MSYLRRHLVFATIPPALANTPHTAAGRLHHIMSSTTQTATFSLTWLSGHTPPRRMYYQKTTEAWNATEDRRLAHQFATPRAALDAYRSVHAFPSEFEHLIANGTVRAEHQQQPELALAGHITL